VLGWVLRLDRLTNDKWDVNESGNLSLGVPGANYAYPEAGWALRDQIYHFHRKHNQGLLFFLANDERVPPEIRDRLNDFGLCADEFTDNANWPRQFYLREGRRMVGRHVVAQADQDQLRSKNDIIGLASYPVDSHTASRWIDGTGRLMVEGSFFGSGTRRWAIPYRALTPNASEATNLLVTTTVSATHVGYASLRMEPQFMIMGHAAGIAAAMANASGGTVQNVSVASLQTTLKARGAVLTDPGDIGASIFYNDIVWAFREGIILNCGPGLFCPTGIVSRADMADFISRARDLPPASRDFFTDDTGHPSEDNINRMAQAGITAGCSATRFCPTQPVTRAQMASFLKRAYGLAAARFDHFTDDETSVHESDINRLAESGITRGCTPTRFCPTRTIVRGEMMAFLHRAAELDQ
jgi:FAD dependent oxidoreductase/S-layer homology domain